MIVIKLDRLKEYLEFNGHGKLFDEISSLAEDAETQYGVIHDNEDGDTKVELVEDIFGTLEDAENFYQECIDADSKTNILTILLEVELKRETN